MTDNSETSTPLEVDDVPQELDNSPGSQLRRARERAGLSLKELSGRLCMTLGKLELLERDEYDRLPGALYVRGYIRNACKELGIDAGPVLEAFSSYSAAEEESRALLEHVRRAPVMEPKPRRNLHVLALLPLLAVAGIFWWLHGRQPAPPDFSAGVAATPGIAGEEQRMLAESVPTAESAEPGPQMEAPAADLGEAESEEPGIAAAGEQAPAVEEIAAAEPQEPPVQALSGTAGGAPQLELFFDEEAWIEVKDATGAVLLAKLKPAGSQVTLEGQPPFELMLGNARGTRVRYLGEPVDSEPVGGRRTRKLSVGE